MGCRTGASAGARRVFDARLTLASSLVLMSVGLPAAAQDFPGDQDQQGQNIPIQGAPPAAPAAVLNAGNNGAAAAAAAGPDAERRPAFQITPSASIQGTYTDNVFLTSTNRQSDWLTTPTGSLDITGKTERTQVAAEYSVSGDFYAANSQLNGYRQNLLTVNTFEAVKNTLSVDLRASIDQDNIAQTGPQAATLRSGLANQTQVANATITPSYTAKLGNWGVANLSYSLNEVAYFNGGNNTTDNNLGNSTQQNLVAQLGSGAIFTQLTWDVNISDSISRGSDTHLDQQTAEVDAEYRINSTFRVPVTVGYDNFTEDDSGFASSDISGLFWNTGIHFVPGPRTDLVLRYGRRYDKPYESGKLTYKIFDNLTFTASYDIEVQTQQQGLANGLQGIGVDGNGNIVNPITNLPGTPNQIANNLVNAVYRSRSFQFGVGGVHGLNFFNVTGQITSRDFGTTQGGDRTSNINATLGRNIGPLTSLSLLLTADHTTDADTVIDQGKTTGITTGLDFNYKLSDKTSFGVDLTRRHQIGTFKSDEDALVVQLSHKF